MLSLVRLVKNVKRVRDNLRRTRAYHFYDQDSFKLEDIPPETGIIGVLWNLTIRATGEKVLHIQLSKTGQNIKIILPLSLPPRILYILIDPITKDLKFSVINKELMISRESGTYKIFCKA